MQGTAWLIYPLSNGRIFAWWFLLAELRADFPGLGFLLCVSRVFLCCYRPLK